MVYLVESYLQVTFAIPPSPMLVNTRALPASCIQANRSPNTI